MAANADVFVGSEIVEEVVNDGTASEVVEEAMEVEEVASVSGDIEKGNFTSDSTSDSTSVAGGARKGLRLVTD